MDLFKISDGKYKFKDNKIDGGAFSNIYDIENKMLKANNKPSNNKKPIQKYVVKLHKYKYKQEAINEINMLLKLKKNKKKYKESLKTLLPSIVNDANKDNFMKSKLIKIKDFYIKNDYIYTIFKKYDITLDNFNIKYNKQFNEIIPISLIKKLFNSLFIGLYELHFSKLIHCDIKPNNILINLFKYKTVDDLFKDVANKKIKKEDLHKFIDIKIIDFNKTQCFKSIFKSVNIQTLYYTPPEIVLGNRNFNYSIDIWAMMNIIHELTTSLFIFDVFNENDLNGINYINFNNSSKSENSESRESESSESDSDESYGDEKMSNLALLYIYTSKLGENKYIEGDFVDKYYSFGKLIGMSNILIQQNSIIIQHNNTDFVNKLLILCNNIYIYDFQNRIKSEEIIRNYLF